MKISNDRALSAFFGAAITGGLATATGILVAMAAPALTWSMPSLGDLLTGAMMAAVMIAAMSIYTSFVFGVGLFLFGLPAWAVLYRLGWRRRWIAVVAGGALAGATAGGLAVAMSGPGWGVAGFTAIMLVSGGVAGWTLHRIAYGRSPAP